MTGRLVALALVGAALAAGAGLYWLEQFHYYDVREVGAGSVTFTTAEGAAADLAVTGMQVAEGEASPLKYRACFRIDAASQELAARFAPYPDAAPTVAPRAFPCFDAAAIAAALDAGEAVALMGTPHVVYGIDRVIAVTGDGRGFAWHQLNLCGQTVYDGDPAPEGCPPPPDPDA